MKIFLIIICFVFISCDKIKIGVSKNDKISCDDVVFIKSIEVITDSDNKQIYKITLISFNNKVYFYTRENKYTVGEILDGTGENYYDNKTLKNKGLN